VAIGSVVEVDAILVEEIVLKISPVVDLPDEASNALARSSESVLRIL
jgi:hypothetical protein